MTDIDRYITVEAVQTALRGQFRPVLPSQAALVLRAALPGILAQHRADVLREAALILDRQDERWYPAVLRRMADEVVSE